jgi:MraZ protein
MVMRPEEFNTLYHKIKEMNITDGDARDFGRSFFGNAVMVELDKAGRVLLPQFLRTKAHLDTAVKLVGLGPYFEVWSMENWSSKEEKIDDPEYRATQFKGLNLTF